MEKISSEKAVRRMLQEKPQLLIPLQECLEMAKTTKNDFAGAWVFDRLKARGVKLSNLRPLAAYEILEKTGVTRGGRRAYYSIIDIEGVEKVLDELGYK